MQENLFLVKHLSYSNIYLFYVSLKVYLEVFKGVYKIRIPVNTFLVPDQNYFDTDPQYWI